LPLTEKVVVVNTSPIIYLSSINQISLLKKLFQKVFIPDAVKREVLSGGKDSFGVREIKGEKWIKTQTIKNELAKKYLLTDIDDGEAEVIILAEELKASTIIMDDRLGRKIAKLRGFNVIGTLRILVAAKEKGLITEIKPLIKKLKEVGFWISDDVYRAILKQAKE
jgi:predicted nucleic acid-binding protein